MALEWKRGTFVYDAGGLGHTPVNLMNAIQSFLTQVGWQRASWDSTTARAFLRTDRGSNPYWKYDGDGIPQACGILVTLDSPNSQIIINTFLENTTADGMQRSSQTLHQGIIAIDNTAPNNLLFIGGEAGFYWEDGRDGFPNNLAHGMVIAWEAVPEYNGTDDSRITITTQGAVCDLFGPLKFTDDRSFKLVDARNGNKNYTGRLKPYVVRGAPGFNGQSVVNDPQIAIGPRDNFMSMYGAESSQASPYAEAVLYCFGILLTPRDGRYRISPLMVVQCPAERYNCCAVGGGNNDGPASNAGMRDARAMRQAKKFVVTDSSLIPFVNLTDAATSIIYRVAQVADNGRTCNIGIEWPDNTNVVTVVGT